MFTNFLSRLYLRTYFRNACYIVWDFDGTFYSNNKVAEVLFTAFQKLTYDQGTKFGELSQQYGSWSKAAAHILDIQEYAVIQQAETLAKKHDFLTPNFRLVKLIRNFKNQEHILLTNSPRSTLIKSLYKLGFDDPTKMFKHIITPDETGVLKPDLEAFNYVLQLTNASPQNHLMVGDSDTSDINPALQVGMKAINCKRLFLYENYILRSKI